MKTTITTLLILSVIPVCLIIKHLPIHPMLLVALPGILVHYTGVALLHLEN